MRPEMSSKINNIAETDDSLDVLLKKTELLSINIKDYKNQIIGGIPGLEIEDVLSLNKMFFELMEKIKNNDPSKTLDSLFKTENDFDWFSEALEVEREKKEIDQNKNLKLKEYIKKSLQERINFFDKLLKDPKIGYFFSIIIDKYYDELCRICDDNNMEINTKTKQDNSIPQFICATPSVKDVRLQRENFIDTNGREFRIKYGSVFLMEKDHTWTPIEKVREYTEINPDLINSSNIIKLMSFDKFFYSNYDFPVYDISLKEKIYLYQFLLSSDTIKVDKFNKVFHYLNKDVFFLKSFFSISNGGKEMGDKIINLGEKLPKKIGEKVFAKYGEIIDTADKAEEEIRKIFGDKDVPTRVLSSVKETLLKRGAKMLSDLGDRVMDENFKTDEQELLHDLDDIKAETIVLGEAYVNLYKEGIRVPIEDVTEIEEIPTGDLTEDQKKQLISVYVNGRPKVTYENENHLKLLKEEFEQELNNKDISVFNIRFNGDIIIFAIVDKKDKDTLYIGGLTFIDEVRNPIIADASMSCVLEKFKNFNIKALVDSRNPILAMYQKRFGFKIIKELPREENAGELYYEIERPREIEKDINKNEKLERAA